MYQVELVDPTWDSIYAQETGAGCWESQSGTVVRLVEDNVSMTLDEANTVLSEHAAWLKWSEHSGRVEYVSPMYDADGYAAKQDLDPELRQMLRELGPYPDPTTVHETVYGFYI